jgi:hypothetical protein
MFKKFKNKRLILTIALTLAMLTSMGIVANAYSSEDMLYTKLSIFGCSSLRTDINNDGTTNVLDLLELKNAMLKEALDRQ